MTFSLPPAHFAFLPAGCWQDFHGHSLTDGLLVPEAPPAPKSCHHGLKKGPFSSCVPCEMLSDLQEITNHVKMAVTFRVSGKISLWSVLGLYRARLPGSVQTFQLGYSITKYIFLEQKKNAICFLILIYSTIHNFLG